MNTIDGLYPVKIRESRYGVYEEGQWILTAGLSNPEQQTDIVAGDVPCREFWDRVRDEGPLLVIEGADWDDSDKQVYIAAGNDVQELLDDLYAFVKASDEYETHAETVIKMIKAGIKPKEREREGDGESDDI